MNRLHVKQGLVALGIAVTLGGAAVGVAGAQQATATRTPAAAATGTPAADQRAQREDQFLNTLAGKLGVTVDKLKQAITDARTELGLPAGRGFGFGPGGPGGGPGDGRHGHGFGGSPDAAAQAIGISVDQLRQELPGKSLADVAKAHNVDPAKVAAALKAAEAARIDQAVTDGRLTADQAAQRKQEANTRIDQMLTQAMPTAPAGGQGGPDGFGRRGGQGQPGGPGAPAPQGTPGAQRSGAAA